MSLKDSNLGWVLKMAWRNIFRHRGRSVLTGLMLTGGYALFSLSLGMSNGSYDVIIDMFTRDRTGHVQVHAPGYRERPRIENTLSDWPAIEGKLRAVRGLAGASPRVLSSSLAFRGNRTTALRLVGVDLEREPKVTRIREKVKEGEFLEPGDNRVLLSRSVAKILSLSLGDEFAMVTQGADGSIANDLFTLAGFLGTEDDPLSRDCVMDISTARRFLALEGRFHEVAILGSRLDGARRLAEEVGRVLGDGFDAAPWQVVEEEFYRAMQVDRKGMWISLFVIMILVALGVLNTVLMNVLERTKEYGILKAMGVRPNGVFALIVAEMGLLSLISLVPGALLGLAANAYFVYVGLAIPEPVSYGGVMFDRMTGSFAPEVFWLPALVTVGTAVLVSLMPAFRARGLTPIDALRDT